MFSIRSFGTDVAAGVSVACVALPLNLALAIAAGLPPAAGLIAGVVAGIVAGMLGGAKLQISGPEAAIVPIVLLIVDRHGPSGLFVAGFLAGLFQIALGLAKVGRVVRYVPVPVVRGFTAGIGLLIIAGQIPRWLGMPAEVRSVSAIARGEALLGATRSSAALVGLAVMAALLLLPRVDKRIPAALLGLVVVSVAVTWFGLDMALVGAIPSSLPMPALPAFSSVDLSALLPDALSLALLASMGSLLSAAAVDGMVRGEKHNSDQELCAQGIANIAASLVGGMPIMGAVVRSTVAIEMGARTRLASVAHAGLLLAAMSIAAAAVAKVPIAALAGILLVVGVRLVNVPEIIKMWRASRADALLLIATTAAIVLTDFLVGVAIGLALSLAVFVQRHPQATIEIERVSPSDVPAPLLGVRAESAPDVAVARLEGSMLFASSTSLDELIDRPKQPRYLVLDVAEVPFIDFTGLRHITDAVEMLRRRGCETMLVGANDAVRTFIERAGVMKLFIGERLFHEVDEAIANVAALPRPAIAIARNGVLPAALREPQWG